MHVRVGGWFVITGLTLALTYSSPLYAIGAVLAMRGGVVLALGMEPVLAETNLDTDPSPIEEGHVDAHAIDWSGGPHG